MLMAAVRDLKRALGAAVAVDVRMPCPALWEHNPHLTPLADGAAGAEEIACATAAGRSMWTCRRSRSPRRWRKMTKCSR